MGQEEAVTGKGMHLALRAASRATVAAVHAAALAASGQDLFTPRERPDISSTYFGAMFLDLDGHRIEVSTNAPTWRPAYPADAVQGLHQQNFRRYRLNSTITCIHGGIGRFHQCFPRNVRNNPNMGIFLTAFWLRGGCNALGRCASLAGRGRTQKNISANGS